MNQKIQKMFKNGNFLDFYWIFSIFGLFVSKMKKINNFLDFYPISGDKSLFDSKFWKESEN